MCRIILFHTESNLNHALKFLQLENLLDKNQICKINLYPGLATKILLKLLLKVIKIIDFLIKLTIFFKFLVLSLQDSSRRPLSAMRGRLKRAAASLQAAIRFRRFSRRDGSDARTPDWFVDKSQQQPDAEGDDKAENKRFACCGNRRIVVDPALPAHYKVIQPKTLPSICHFSSYPRANMIAISCDH